MPLHPMIQTTLAAAQGMVPYHRLPIAQARAQAKLAYPPREQPVAVGVVQDLLIPGPAGALPLRVYAPNANGPHPLMVYFHGSGFVLHDLDTHDDLCRRLCAGAGCVVVSVDYRLAPEHKFPAALDDCLAATRWTADHAGDLHGDAARLMVAGDSAGGNFAAVTALRARDEGGPLLCAQMLIYPVTDHYSADLPSMRDNAEGYGLTRAAMRYYWDHYLNDAGEARHPLAAPRQAASLANLPPALVVTAEYDPLRDEGEDYGAALVHAGVPVTMRRWLGVNHGFFFFPGLVERATVAVDEACAWSRDMLDR